MLFLHVLTVTTMRTVVTPIAVAIPVAVVHTDRFTVFEVQDVIMSRDPMQMDFLPDAALGLFWAKVCGRAREG